MKSKIGMIDQINKVREETGNHKDRIEVYQIHNLWRIYRVCKTHAEFRKQARLYLGWEVR